MKTVRFESRRFGRRAAISFALVTSAIGAGCAMEQAESAPDAQSDAEVTVSGALRTSPAISAQTVIVNPPPPPPPPPPNDCTTITFDKTVRITSDQLDGALKLTLGGTRIVFDTTGTSVPHPGGDPIYVCFDPNRAGREAATAECFAGPPQSKGVCLAQVQEDFPDMTECHWTVGSYHSYIDFSPAVEQMGAEDMVFPGVDPIVRDVWGWGTGSTTTNINNVNTTVGLSTMSAQFGPDQGCGTTVNFTLELSSNNPTLQVEHSYLPAFPDVELTNMVIETKLCGLEPSEDGKQVTFNGPDAAFRFDKNLNNFPDWFVELFVDVEAIIRNKVETKLENALSKETSRTALTSALTTLVKHFAQEQAGTTWTGVEKFTKVRFDNGDLVVSYTPVGAPPPKVICRSFEIADVATAAIK